MRQRLHLIPCQPRISVEKTWGRLATHSVNETWRSVCAIDNLICFAAFSVNTVGWRWDGMQGPFNIPKHLKITGPFLSLRKQQHKRTPETTTSSLPHICGESHKSTPFFCFYAFLPFIKSVFCFHSSALSQISVRGRKCCNRGNVSNFSSFTPVTIAMLFYLNKCLLLRECELASV